VNCVSDETASDCTCQLVAGPQVDLGQQLAVRNTVWDTACVMYGV
jgi:hypothetical protein